MKLTTTKISIPVLMMMLFQSGHGMNNWFWQASELFVSGQTAQAVRIVHQNDPNFFRITDPSKVSPEIQAIIDGTEDRINGWWDSIKAKVADFAPRGLTDVASFQNRVETGFRSLLSGDIDDYTVIIALSEAIADNFYASNYWKQDTGIGTAMLNWRGSVATTWGGTDVPDLEGDQMNEIPEGLLGADYEDEPGPADGTIRKFISGIADYGENDDAWTGAWNTLIGNQLYGLSMLTVGGNTATLALIKAAVADGLGDNAKERNIYDILDARAEELRNAVLSNVIPDDIEVTEEDELRAIYNAVDEEDTEIDRKGAAESSLIDVLNARIENSPADDKPDAVRDFLKVYVWRNADSSDAPRTAIDDILATINSGQSAGDSSFWVVGANLESFLRHSQAEGEYEEEVETRRKDMVQDVDALTDQSSHNDKVAAVLGSLEDFDADTIGQIVTLLQNIKNATPAQ